VAKILTIYPCHFVTGKISTCSIVLQIGRRRQLCSLIICKWSTEAIQHYSNVSAFEEPRILLRARQLVAPVSC
jgi:hypothetical protein